MLRYLLMATTNAFIVMAILIWLVLSDMPFQI